MKTYLSVSELVRTVFFYTVAGKAMNRTGKIFIKETGKRLSFDEFYVFFFLVENCDGLKTGFEPMKILRRCPSVMPVETYKHCIIRLKQEGLIECKQQRGIYVLTEKGLTFRFRFSKEFSSKMNVLLSDYPIKFDPELK